jgi:thiol-disulfide isomerase/thioredoxin
VKVTLYTKEDCGLCDEAAALLRRLQKRIRFDIEFVDIAVDGVAGAQYGERVPVIAVDGVEVAAAPLEEQQLAAILTA